MIIKKIIILILRVTFYFLNLQKISSQCIITSDLEENNCFCCDVFHYDVKYLENLNFNSIMSKKFSKNDCIPKVKLNNSRKVLVLNTNLTNNDIQEDFNHVYDNLIFCFENESLISLNYLYSELTIYIGKGFHFINFNDFNFNLPEFFKKTLVNITMLPYNSQFVDIQLNTYSFFIFISNSFKIEHINFYGIECKKCDQNDNLFENQLLYNKGFFNLEILFNDNFIFAEPILILNDCKFYNFYYYNNYGYHSLISLYPNSGTIIIKNNIFFNDIFSKGIIYCTKENDFFYNVENFNYSIYSKINNLIHNISFINNQIICFNNSLFIIFEWNNLIYFENNTFMKLINPTIIIKNVIRLGTFIIRNLIMNNFQSKIFISVDSFLLIQFISIYFYEIRAKNLINIQNSNYSNFNDLKFVNIKIITHLFEISNTLTTIENSLFLFIVSQSVYFQFKLNCGFHNISFINVQFNHSLFKLLNLQSFELNFTSFYEILTVMSLFYFEMSNTLQTNIILFKKCDIYYLFYINNGILNLNHQIILLNNNLSYIWNEDQTNLISILNSSIIKNNYLRTTIFKNSIISYSNLRFINVHFLFNKSKSRFLFMILKGSFFMKNIIFISNIFNPLYFEDVFDLEEEIIYRIEKSYFLDNGVIEKKYFFFNDYDNCIFSNWNIKLGSFYNVFFIASQQIELTSGFIAGSPTGNLLEIENCLFILKNYNTLFDYKGIILHDINYVSMKNNIFKNWLCNTKSFLHYHGIVLISGSGGYFFLKNEYQVNINNNSFYNCSCPYGGSLAIISIKIVIINNCSFFQSKAKYYGGSFLIISCIEIAITNIIINNSLGRDGGCCFFQNDLSLIISNIYLNNIISNNQGGLYFKNINNLAIDNIKTNNSFSKINAAVFFCIAVIGTIKNINVLNSFTNLEGGLMLILGKTNLTIFSFYSNKSFSKCYGNISVKFAILISILNSSFTRSISLENGSLLFINVLMFFNAINIIIIDSFCYDVGTIYVKTEEIIVNFYWNNISCISDFSKIGSCFYIFSASSFFLENIFIFNNGEVPIYFLWTFLINVIINNLVISNDLSQTNICQFSRTNLIIKDFFFNFNLAYNAVIHILYSNATIKNIYFNNNNKIYVFLIENSFIILDNIVFMNKSHINDYFLDSFDSNLMISNSSIFNFQKGVINFKSGKLIIINLIIENNDIPTLIIKQSNLFIINSKFTNNVSFLNTFVSDILYENNLNIIFKIELNNISFYNYHTSSNKFTGLLEIVILYCYFENLNSNNIPNSAILFENTYNFSIYNSFFSNYSNSAIKIIEPNEISLYNSFVKINNSTFFNNFASLGGAIFIYGNFHVYIIYCNFLENKAFENNFYEKVQGIGGTIYYSLINFKKKAYFELNSSIFFMNFASKFCSTVFSQRKIIQNHLNKIYVNNTKNETFFSYPIYLKLINNDKNNLKIISGLNFDLNIEILDFFSNIIQIDSKSILTLKLFQKESNNIFFLKNNIAISKQGKLIFKNINIKTTPKSYFILTIKGNFLGIPSLAKSKNYILEDEYFFFSRECKIGEIIKDNSCFKCPEGYYSLSDPMITESKYQKCSICPKNAYCIGGSFITPLEGFYRKNNYSNNVVLCINDKGCLGIQNYNESNYDKLDNINEMIHGKCKEGNFGILCFYCDINYGRNDKTDYCRKCGTLIVIVITRFIIYFIFMCSYILLNVFVAEKKQNKSSFSNHLGNYFKQIINHCQQISIILGNSNTPFDTFSYFTSAFDIVSFNNDFVMTNDCLIQKIYYDVEYLSIFKEILNSFLPIMFSAFSFIIWMLIIIIMSKFKRFNYLKLKLPKNIHELNRRIILFIILSGFIFYTLVIKSCFNLFECMKLDITENITYLKKSPNLECWTYSHFKYLYVFSIPGIIIWGLVFPFCLIYILKKNFLMIKTLEIKTGKILTQKSRNNSLNSNSKLVKIERKSFNNLNQTQNELLNSYYCFSFFYKDYKTKYYYWEFLIFIRKFVIIFVYSFSKIINEELNFFILFIFLLTYIYYSAKCSPYNIKNANKLEIVSLIALLITTFASLSFGTSEKYENKLIFTILSLISNIIFFVFSIFLLVKLILSIRLEKFLNKRQNTKKTKEFFRELKILI